MAKDKEKEKQKIPYGFVDVLKTGDIYFKIEDKDSISYFKCSCIIQAFIRANRPVPQRLFEKYNSFFIPVQVDILEKYNAILNEKNAQILNRFINDRDYQFEYTNRTTKQKFSLLDMIEKSLSEALEKYLLEHITKEDCLTICYLSMYNYKMQLNAPNKQFLKHYKISTISAYIAIIIGFHNISSDVEKTLTENGNPTNKELFDAVKYHTNKVFYLQKK